MNGRGAEFGLAYGATKPFEERVLKNGWLTDIYGKALCFTDFGVLELASVEANLGQHASLLVLDEESAGELGLGYRESFEREASDKQRALIGELSTHETLTPEQLDELKREIPALHLANIAITKGVLFFQEGTVGRISGYEHALAHIKQVMAEVEDQAHRDFHVGIRGHLSKEHGTSGLPQARLDDQQREKMRNDISPELNSMFARAQTLSRTELPQYSFIFEVIKLTKN